MSGIEIRPATADDHDAIREVILAAFAEEPGVADVVEELRATRRAWHELVATDGETVVGHVLLNRGWVDDDLRVVDVLVLSPLGVAPDYQQGGIGTALIAAALDAARAAGEALVFLEGAPDYYGSRGFERADRRGFLAPTSRIPAPAFQVAVLQDPDASGRLVYPDAFWAAHAAGLREPELSRLRELLGD